MKQDENFMHWFIISWSSLATRQDEEIRINHWTPSMIGQNLEASRRNLWTFSVSTSLKSSRTSSIPPFLQHWPSPDRNSPSSTKRKSQKVKSYDAMKWMRIWHWDLSRGKLSFDPFFFHSSLCLLHKKEMKEKRLSFCFDWNWTKIKWNHLKLLFKRWRNEKEKDEDGEKNLGNFPSAWKWTYFYRSFIHLEK
jgi:hypothetical protein